jgi:hypothetical protein
MRTTNWRRNENDNREGIDEETMFAYDQRVSRTAPRRQARDGRRNRRAIFAERTR